MNKYDHRNEPLAKVFTRLALDFAKKAESLEEEKILLLMAREVWNISYFDEEAQQREIQAFIESLEVEPAKQQIYTRFMTQGIREKHKATKQIDLKDVWTRVEHFKAWKANDQYKVEFEFDFYE